MLYVRNIKEGLQRNVAKKHSALILLIVHVM